MNLRTIVVNTECIFALMGQNWLGWRSEGLETGSCAEPTLDGEPDLRPRLEEGESPPTEG